MFAFQATPDMEMIREQLDQVGKNKPDEEIRENSSYHGHFSENEGVFSIFLDMIQDIQAKLSRKSQSQCNCYVKSSKGLTSWAVQTPLPSETIDSQDLPEVLSTMSKWDNSSCGRISHLMAHWPHGPTQI